MEKRRQELFDQILQPNLLSGTYPARDGIPILHRQQIDYQKKEGYLLKYKGLHVLKYGARGLNNRPGLIQGNNYLY